MIEQLVEVVKHLMGRHDQHSHAGEHSHSISSMTFEEFASTIPERDNNLSGELNWVISKTKRWPTGVDRSFAGNLPPEMMRNLRNWLSAQSTRPGASVHGKDGKYDVKRPWGMVSLDVTSPRATATVDRREAYVRTLRRAVASGAELSTKVLDQKLLKEMQHVFEETQNIPETSPERAESNINVAPPELPAITIAAKESAEGSGGVGISAGNVPLPQFDSTRSTVTSPYLRDIASPVITRHPTEETKSGLLEKYGQVDDLGHVLTAYDAGHSAYLLANGTGTGKTFIAAGLLVNEKPKRSLWVVPNRQIAQKTIDEIKKVYGLDLQIVEGKPSGNGHFITTYKQLQMWKDSNDLEDVASQGWDQMIFDECHSMKNAASAKPSKQAAAGMALADASKKVLFMSATPFQSVQEMGYLEKMGLWDNFYGFLQDHKYSWKETSIGGYWKFNGDINDLISVYRDMLGKGIASHNDLKLDVDLDNQFLAVPLPPEVQKIYTRVDEEFLNASDNIANPLLRGMVNAQRTLALRRVMEFGKIELAIVEAKKLRAQGRQVAVFVGYRVDMQPPQIKKIPALSDRLQPIYDDLKRLDDVTIKRLITALGGPDDVAQVHGGVPVKQRSSDIADYNSGKKKYLVATAASGGTGLSLHDTDGSRPRAQLNVYMPWSGQEFTQIAGRSYRAGSKSDVKQIWMFADTEKERSIAKVVGGRLAHMGALVKGIESSLDARRMAEFDFGIMDTIDSSRDRKSVV